MTDTGTVAPPTSSRGTAAPFVYDLIRAQARSSGDRDALVDLVAGSNRSLSYAALVDRVEALADRLRAGGAGPEQPVAVLLDRSIDTVVAMLAVLASGGAYCPLDVTAPNARTTAIMRNLGVRIAIADGANAARLPAGTVVVSPSGTERAGTGTTPGPRRPDDLAYVLHTSGSTGVPKGVAMTHRGLSRLIGWQVASGAPGLRTLQFTATSFDVTFQEVLSTLATGGCLVVASEDVRRDPAALLDMIVEQRIQRLFLPYVALQLLAVAAQRRRVVPDSLEHVVTAGERLIITPAIRELFAAIPRCRLDNHYGPTEAHLVTSLTLPADADRLAGRRRPSAHRWTACPAACSTRRSRRRGRRRRRALRRGSRPGPRIPAATGANRGAVRRRPGRAPPRRPPVPHRRPGPRMGRRRPTSSSAGLTTSSRCAGSGWSPPRWRTRCCSHPRVDAAAVGLREVADGVPCSSAYLQTDGPVAHRDITDHVRGLLPAYMVPSRCRHDRAAAPDRDRQDRRCGRSRSSTCRIGPSLPAPAAAVAEPSSSPRSGPGARPRRVRRTTTTSSTSAATRCWRPGSWPSWDRRSAARSSCRSSWTTAPSRTSPARWRRRAGAGPRPRSSQIRHAACRPVRPQRCTCCIRSAVSSLLPGAGPRLAGPVRLPRRRLGAATPPAFGTSLPEIARTHVEQLRTVQPAGPYQLAGWSFGGVLAYEIAQQLVAAGEVVDFLGLFDANPVIDPITGLPMAETPFLAMLDDVVAALDDPAAPTSPS